MAMTMSIGQSPTWHVIMATVFLIPDFELHNYLVCIVEGIQYPLMIGLLQTYSSIFLEG